MKWYSIKKYRPPQDGYCLIRTEHGSFYSAEWRGGSDDTDSDYSCGWMMDTLCDSLTEEVNCSWYVEIFGVTHFLIPSPVEVEE